MPVKKVKNCKIPPIRQPSIFDPKASGILFELLKCVAKTILQKINGTPKQENKINTFVQKL